jgi:hypothetical protein
MAANTEKKFIDGVPAEMAKAIRASNAAAEAAMGVLGRAIEAVMAEHNLSEADVDVLMDENTRTKAYKTLVARLGGFYGAHVIRQRLTNLDNARGELGLMYGLLVENEDGEIVQATNDAFGELTEDARGWDELSAEDRKALLAGEAIDEATA